jgi:eukaryotic-like serine/threonine-protein kinase
LPLQTSAAKCQHCGLTHQEGLERCPRSHELMSAVGLIGQRVDRYQIEQLLGVGGFGSVYRAQHIHTDAHVALKLLRKQLCTDGAMVERFLREAKAAAALGNEHIIRILDAGITPDGQAFLALEFLQGCDLQELAQREGPLTVARIVDLALQVLDGLAAAHAKGIVHRDMKPANVFVNTSPADFVKILDFGISKMHGDTPQTGLTMTGMAMGTPSYMAPEQFFDAKSVDGRADLYSVAAMLYELLARRLPIEATSYADLIVKVKTEAPPPLRQVAPQVSLSLAQVVSIGLAKSPGDRWQTPQEFASSLRACLDLPAVSNQAPEAAGAGVHRPKPNPEAPVRLDATYTPPPQARPPATPHAVPNIPLASGPERSQGVAPPPAARPPPERAPIKSNATKWVLISVAMMLVLSCFCCLAAGAVNSGNETPQTHRRNGP